MDFVFDPSLVLYLPLWKLDGASIMSQDAYGHACTVTGALGRPHGHYFDGSDDYITIAANSTLQSLTVGSIEVWAKFDDLNSNRMPFAASDIGDATSYMGLYWISADGNMWAICYNDGSELYNAKFAGTGLTAGQWYHFVLVQDGTEPDLYLDTIKYDLATGEPDPTGWFADVLNIDTVTVGIARRSGGNYFDHNGNIGEVRVYNRALTPLEIQHNYLATKWRYK